MKQSYTGFVAYPSNPHQIGNSIEEGLKKLKIKTPSVALESWIQNDVAGYCLVDPIIEKIETSDVLVADITKLNFNVMYEIGYAIGKSKRVLLIQNGTIENDSNIARRMGILDTLGYTTYNNSNDLTNILSKSADLRPLGGFTSLNKSTPVFVLSPLEKADEEIRIISKLKKTSRVPFRIFDPQETGRLGPVEALTEVSQSTGVILPLLAQNRKDYLIHNLRCSFVAGISHALEKETLILQYLDEVVPLDYRDGVSSYSSLEQIDGYVSEFASRSMAKALSGKAHDSKESDSRLSKFPIGAPAAENEMSNLPDYFLPTDEYARLINGEVEIVAGRKGAGKTALFFLARNTKRKDKQNIVLDLRPEGFQLKKLKTIVLDRLEEGTREHTITAFWEYLFLLEICYKIIEKDRSKHLHDHTIRDKYIELKKNYFSDVFVSEGDFAERLLKLTSSIESKFIDLEGEKVFTKEKITELIYHHDLTKLRNSVFSYLELKGELWILFDNIDKGWASSGVDESDLMLLRCLLDAVSKLRREFRRKGIKFFGSVFVRNDVLELLVSSQSDRGKLAKIVVDWTDPDLLRELLRRRLVSNLDNKKYSFDEIWREMVQSHICGGQESSQYFIDRSLMRPRALLEFLRHAKSHAVNLNKNLIDESSIIHGETAYSIDLIHQVDLEIRDVFHFGEDLLYSFIECDRYIGSEEVEQRLASAGLAPVQIPEVIESLIWFGFFGLVKDVDNEVYIYDVHYDMRKLRALFKQKSQGDLLYAISPAFWRGLEIST